MSRKKRDESGGRKKPFFTPFTASGNGDNGTVYGVFQVDAYGTRKANIEAKQHAGVIDQQIAQEYRGHVRLSDQSFTDSGAAVRNLKTSYGGNDSFDPNRILLVRA
jgi:hypothetical protein